MADVLSIVSTTDFTSVLLEGVQTISFDNDLSPTSATFSSRQFDDDVQISQQPTISGSATADSLIVNVMRGAFIGTWWQFQDWSPGDLITFNGSTRNDIIDGTIADDAINGCGGQDALFGDYGNDILSGGRGDDWLYGGDDNDTLVGGLGNDELDGGIGDDTLYGGAGDDILNDWTNSDDILRGGEGNDELQDWYGANTLMGGGGDDKIVSHDTSPSSGADHINGGIGNDWLVLDYGWDVALTVDIRQGGGGADIGEGTTIRGIERLTITTGYLNDVIFGGQGDDIVDAAGGNDILDGGAGNDQLLARSGNNTVNGGAGDDFLQTVDGQQTIDGGAGVDTYDMDCDGLAVGVIVNITAGGGGADIGNGTRISNIEALLFWGSSYGDVVTGGALDDRLAGVNGNDVLNGGAGNDVLWAGNGKDTLVGGAGNDELEGGGDRDSLEGGLGEDLFVFSHFSDSHPIIGSDTIIDFELGIDKIDLSAIAANYAENNSAFSFIGALPFSGTAGELRISQGPPGYLLVSGDTFGDGTADLVIAVMLVTTLTVGDFIL